MRGDEDAFLLENPLPDLARRLTGRAPESTNNLVELVYLGARSTRRLAVCGHGGGIAMLTWPAELKPKPSTSTRRVAPAA